MILANETSQTVFYTITNGNAVDCGTIAPEAVADVSYYDNQQNVTVEFSPVDNSPFSLAIPQTATGEAVQMLLVVE